MADGPKTYGGSYMMNKNLKFKTKKVNSSVTLKDLKQFDVKYMLDEVSNIISLRLPNKVLGELLIFDYISYIINITNINTPLNTLLYSIAELDCIHMEFDIDMHTNLQYDSSEKEFYRQLDENEIILLVIESIENFVKKEFELVKETKDIPVIIGEIESNDEIWFFDHYSEYEEFDYDCIEEEKVDYINMLNKDLCKAKEKLFNILQIKPYLASFYEEINKKS